MSYFESPSELYGKNFGFGSPEEGLPKLKSGLVVRQQTYQHEVFFMIKDAANEAYYKYPPSDWDIVRLFDGEHTPKQIVNEYNLKYPLNPIDEEVVESYISSLKEIELIEVSAREK